MAQAKRGELIAALRASLDRQRRFQEDPEKSHKEYSAIFNEFHEVLYTFSGNMWMKSSAMEYNSLLFLADVSKHIDFPDMAVQVHQAVLQAILEDDLPKALENMRIHRARE